MNIARNLNAIPSSIRGVINNLIEDSIESVMDNSFYPSTPENKSYDLIERGQCNLSIGTENGDLYTKITVKSIDSLTESTLLKNTIGLITQQDRELTVLDRSNYSVSVGITSDKSVYTKITAKITNNKNIKTFSELAIKKITPKIEKPKLHDDIIKYDHEIRINSEIQENKTSVIGEITENNQNLQFEYNKDVKDKKGNLQIDNNYLPKEEAITSLNKNINEALSLKEIDVNNTNMNLDKVKNNNTIASEELMQGLKKFYQDRGRNPYQQISPILSKVMPSKQISPNIDREID